MGGRRTASSPAPAATKSQPGRPMEPSLPSRGSGRMRTARSTVRSTWHAETGHLCTRCPAGSSATASRAGRPAAGGTRLAPRDSAQAYDCSSRARPVLRKEDLVMRWFVIAIVAVTALAGATFAFASAGSEGDQGTGTAYALVDPNGGVPQLIGAHTNGFIAVSSPIPGIYCLTPATGVDVAHTAAVASEEAFYSNALGFPTVRY